MAQSMTAEALAAAYADLDQDITPEMEALLAQHAEQAQAERTALDVPDTGEAQPPRKRDASFIHNARESGISDHFIEKHWGISIISSKPLMLYLDLAHDPHVEAGGYRLLNSLEEQIANLKQVLPEVTWQFVPFEYRQFGRWWQFWKPRVLTAVLALGS